MLRVLLYVLPIILTIFAIVDCALTDDDDVPHLPKFIWIILIFLFPIVGAIVWFILSRHHRRQRYGAQASMAPANPFAAPARTTRRRPVAPDDDPEFLRQLRKKQEQQEQLIAQWEAEFKNKSDLAETQKSQPDSQIADTSAKSPDTGQTGATQPNMAPKNADPVPDDGSEVAKPDSDNPTPNSSDPDDTDPTSPKPVKDN